jgi:predicted Zn-dependent protease
MDDQEEHEAIYFDGRSNHKRRVVLRFHEGIEIVEDGAVADIWPYAAIRRVDGPTGSLRLSSTSALPLARLQVEDAAAAEIAKRHCATLDSGAGERRQTWRIVVWSLAAACSIMGFALYGIPYAADRIAPFVPAALERRMGEALDTQVRAMFDGKVCTGAEGQAAFTQLVDGLKTAAGMNVDFDAHVLSARVPNAFALPGGKIYLLDGLLQRAQSPDEVAGVLAHEIGHVSHRDGVRRLIQTGGTSFLMGLLFGDVTGAGAVIFVGRAMVDASYSRDQEHAADAFAVEVMHRLGRSPKPMGELLLRVASPHEKKSLSILAGHPMSEARLAEMTRQDRPATGPELLTPAQWQALKGMCKAE